MKVDLSALSIVYALLLQLVDQSCGSEDVTQIPLHKGWVRGNRHDVLNGTIGKYV